MKILSEEYQDTLFEFARVATLRKNTKDPIYLYIYGKEFGNHNIPHFHFYNQKYMKDFVEKRKKRPYHWKDLNSLSKKKKLEVMKYRHGCILLLDPKYYDHTDAWDKLTDEEIEELIKFMQNNYQELPITGWQRLCMQWNEEYSNDEIDLMNLNLVPDYNKLNR